MYHRFVERKVRETFRQLSEGDWESSVGEMSPSLYHCFPGDHALGEPRGLRVWTMLRTPRGTRTAVETQPEKLGKERA